MEQFIGKECANFIGLCSRSYEKANRRPIHQPVCTAFDFLYLRFTATYQHRGMLGWLVQLTRATSKSLALRLRAES